tara:strand:- start:1192 stop:2682 length:1491 start_codon:yes stop_codon:yes gene_type:complete
MIKIIIFLGFLINFIAYENFYSAIFFFSIFCISRLTINIFLSRNENRDTEKDLALWLSSFFYLLTGIIELCIINYGSAEMTGPDAFYFFKNASDPTWNLKTVVYENLYGSSITESSGFKEDFIPILIWNKVYGFFQYLGFSPGRYLGLSVNTLFMIWTSFIGLSIIRSTSDLNNKRTENFYKILFSINGIYWMYGAIFLREAIIIFIVSILLKIWIDWIQKKSFFNLIKLGVISTLYYIGADYLRGGYSILIGAFLASFVFVELYKSFYDKKINIFQVFSVPIILAIIFFNTDLLNNSFDYFVLRFESYNKSSELTSDYGSLGLVLLQQPFFVRIFFSVFYMLFMPIPILNFSQSYISFYHIFKSVYAIFNYITIPFLIINLKNTLSYFKRIDETKLFLIVLYILTTFAIGLTSLENRHYGNFSLIYLLLISYFNWEIIILRNEYKRVLSYLFIILYLLYFAYVFLKFKSLVLILIFLLAPLFIFNFVKKENTRLK